MSVELNPFSREEGTFAAIGSAFTVTLGKMLDAGRDVDENASLLPYVRAGNIQDSGLDLSDANSMPFTPAEAAALDLRAGDVLVVEGGAVGTCVVLDDDMPGWSFQKTVNRLRAVGDWQPRFVGYVLRAYRDAGVIDIVCNKSTIPHLTAEKLRALRVPAWDAHMQRAIADFLDRETAQIDELIAAQRRLIDMLAERRTAVVDSVVTTGLNRAATTKDSGVDWIGSVPTHWELRPLWAMFRRIKDVDHPDEQMLSVFRDYGVVVKDSRDNINQTAENRSIYQLVHPGWLVANRMKAWQGSVGISSLRGIVSGHYICFEPLHSEDHDYLNWLFRSARYAAGYGLISRGVRIGQAEIDNDSYRVLPVVVPPIEEQQRIAAHLADQTSKIDTLIAEAERFIELARERRSALVVAAVTGQVPMEEAV